MRKVAFLIMSLALAGACRAEGEKNLGTVLDAGAVRLSKQDVLAKVIGSWIEFTTRSGMVFQFQPDQEGRVFGHARGFKSSTRLKGSWQIDDDGKLCLDFRGEKYGEFQRCHFWFGSQDGFWSSPSTDDRNAVVLEMKPIQQ